MRFLSASAASRSFSRLRLLSAWAYISAPNIPSVMPAAAISRPASSMQGMPRRTRPERLIVTVVPRSQTIIAYSPSYLRVT